MTQHPLRLFPLGWVFSFCQSLNQLSDVCESGDDFGGFYESMTFGTRISLRVKGYVV